MRSPKHRRTLALLASIAVLKSAAGERQSIGYYLDDGAITFKVITALHDERSLEASGLIVVTEDGIVRLTGNASSRAQIETAAQVARTVSGVQSVTNEIRLKPN